MKGLIHRAHVLCDEKQDLLDELSLLRDVFIANGYPEKLVNNTLEKSWEVETLKAVLVGVQQELKAENQKEYYDVLHAPYVQGFSETLQRKLKRFQVGYVPKRGETLYNKLCRLKQTVELEDWKDVVYAIGCDTCGVHYVGEIGQHYYDRRRQHQGDVRNRKATNGIYDHLKNNEGHKVNWDKVNFLDKEINWKGRKIKESIYINSLNPTMKIDPSKLMNLEKGFDLDPIWSEFNPVFRNIIQIR